jgi:hypothetical protein
MPVRVAQNEEVFGAFEGDIAVGMIRESLKNLCVRMAEHEGIKLPCPVACGSGGTHSHMSALASLADFFTSESPAASRPWISLDLCLVKKPQVNFRIAKKGPEQLHKDFSLFLVLSVWLRSWHFEAKVLVVQPPDYCAISDLLVKPLGQTPVEFLSGPMSLMAHDPDVVSMALMKDHYSNSIVEGLERYGGLDPKSILYIGEHALNPPNGLEVVVRVMKIGLHAVTKDLKAGLVRGSQRDGALRGRYFAWLWPMRKCNGES